MARATAPPQHLRRGTYDERNDSRDRQAAPRSEEINILRIGLLLPPGFDVLSFAPLSVFITANSVSAEPFYEAHVVSVSGGRVSNSFGMFVDTERAGDIALDTLLVGTTP